MGFATLLYSLSSSQFRVVYEAPDDWYVGAGESRSARSPDFERSCVHSCPTPAKDIDVALPRFVWSVWKKQRKGRHLLPSNSKCHSPLQDFTLGYNSQLPASRFQIVSTCIALPQSAMRRDMCMHLVLCAYILMSASVLMKASTLRYMYIRKVSVYLWARGYPPVQFSIFPPAPRKYGNRESQIL